MNGARGVPPDRVALALMTASGFAGLSYQIVWTQQSALWLGHESAAVLAVVAAFFGGLSLGALALGPRVERSPRPARWYAACELALALWSLCLTFVMPPFSAWALQLTGVQPSPSWQWAVAFFGTLLLLLPATAAMGATLPAMERILAALPGRGQTRSIAALYAANTAGAVCGVLGAAFWLVPGLGLRKTTLIAAALNALCALLSWRVFAPTGSGSESVSPASASEASATMQEQKGDRSAVRRVAVQLAVTGLLGIGYEVLVVRVLSQVSENTVYTFALLLAVYLVGSATGAAIYERDLRQRSSVAQPADPLRGDRLLAALSAACVLGTASLWAAPSLKASALSVLGDGITAAILAEAVPALFAFGPATLVMGALFSHLSRNAHASGLGFGRALGINTLGAALAPALFGVLALPSLGPKLALLLIDIGYLALVSRRSWSRALVWGTAIAVAALVCFAPPLAFIDLPEGGHVVSYRDGVMAAVSVDADADGELRLRINNRQQEGSNRTQRVDGRQAWLPLLLHPAPKHALFLGLGTGVTASSAAEDLTLEVEAVELLPEVIAASAQFAPSVADGAAYPRLHVRAADARRFVRTSERQYDVIVADNFHPARSGSGSLYTTEHFSAVRERLSPQGLFCQWLPLHQLDRESLRSIVHSFMAVYPEGAAIIASNSLETPVLGLIGRRDHRRFDASRLQARLSAVALPSRVAGLGFEDEYAVLGSFVAGPAALRRLAEGAPANTDDHPFVAYRAPSITYAPDSKPGERLIALLHELSLQPRELIEDTADEGLSRRLAAYWAARDRFIESGRDVHPAASVEDMLAQVRGPLLDVLRISPDFRPAYDPLLGMAKALAGSDAPSARELLTELSRVQPARTEAALALAAR